MLHYRQLGAAVPVNNRLSCAVLAGEKLHGCQCGTDPSGAGHIALGVAKIHGAGTAGPPP